MEEEQKEVMMNTLEANERKKEGLTVDTAMLIDDEISNGNEIPRVMKKERGKTGDTVNEVNEKTLDVKVMTKVRENAKNKKKLSKER